jgi:hypothetical protein
MALVEKGTDPEFLVGQRHLNQPARFRGSIPRWAWVKKSNSGDMPVLRSLLGEKKKKSS